MPDSNIETQCIVCGRSSLTKVCMHCFFNYDYRTYNSRELERKAPIEEAQDAWMLNLDTPSERDDCEMDDLRFSDPLDDDDSSGHGFGLSWLPKFPRFS